MTIDLRRIALPIDDFEELAAEARGEGWRFVDRLRQEWDANINRFSGPGEVLFGAFENDRLIAVAGLNRDPYTNGDRTGRLRHLYVRSRWRRRGIAEALVRAVLDAARTQFQSVRLRTGNPAAARLYRRSGFRTIEHRDATHEATLSTVPDPNRPRL
jgi:GNAT superfamily N-acetyltransferase